MVILIKLAGISAFVYFERFPHFFRVLGKLIGRREELDLLVHLGDLGEDTSLGAFLCPLLSSLLPLSLEAAPDSAAAFHLCLDLLDTLKLPDNTVATQYNSPVFCTL